ncbi:MAG: site-2 protease family protein [Pirellulales bacterium]|nr:site-2 protease family protein [Pirellulales bacterium]
MFLTEPARTNYDLHFRLAGIPVRVHPLFWVFTLMMGLTGDARPMPVLIWLVAVFVSILVHELGHALAIRYYGWRPSITLYAFGGLASYNPADDLGYDPDFVLGEQAWRVRSLTSELVILFAGPGAGFLLAATIIMAVNLWGMATGGDIGVLFFYDPATLIGTFVTGLFHLEPLLYLLNDLLYINIFWGLLNLLPIFPLDGGQISQKLFYHYQGPRGLLWAAQLAIAACVAMVLFVLLRWNDEQRLFGMLMFGSLGFTNFQIYRGLKGLGDDIDSIHFGQPPRDRDRQPWESDDDDDRPSWR